MAATRAGQHSRDIQHRITIEITPEVADGPHSVILEQVTNGVAVRMAVLFQLLGGTRDE